MLRSSVCAVVALCVLATAACSNTKVKKKPGSLDASTFEGGADGTGAGGADAGPDAALEAAPEAAPEAALEAAPEAGLEAAPDALLDAPSEPEAGLTCSAGTIKDYALQTCLACPGGSDASTDGGDAGAMLDGSASDASTDAGSDPYVSTLDCAGVLGNATGSYDPSTGVLDLQLTYPLEIESVAVSGMFYSGLQQLAGFSLGSLPISDNHIVLDVGVPPSGADNLVIQTLDLSDACGRNTSYVPGGCLDLDLLPNDAGASWTPACIINAC